MPSRDRNEAELTHQFRAELATDKLEHQDLVAADNADYVATKQNTFYSSLKTLLFSRARVGSASE